MTRDESISFLPGWDLYSKPLQDLLRKQSRVRSEKAGSVVFQQGSDVEVIAWTLKGQLFSCVQHENGTQTLLTHVPVGRMILFNFVWKQTQLDRDFVAMTDVELLILPRVSTIQLLAQFDEFKMQVIESLTERLNDLDRALYTHKVASREACIASFLVDCEQGQNSGVLRQHRERQLPLSMQFIAECLRLSRPFVAKTLKHFAEMQLITLRYGQILVLNTDGLRKLAASR